MLLLISCADNSEWVPNNNMPIQQTLKKQKGNVKQHFKKLVDETITQFAEQGLNAVLSYENTDARNFISLVPTSAHTGEGIPDLLMLLVKLTQTYMADKLAYVDNLECTILEVMADFQGGGGGGRFRMFVLFSFCVAHVYSPLNSSLFCWAPLDPAGQGHRGPGHDGGCHPEQRYHPRG